jgi:hypothetical protein
MFWEAKGMRYPNLAKVGVEGSSPFARSNLPAGSASDPKQDRVGIRALCVHHPTIFGTPGSKSSTVSAHFATRST